MAKRRLMASKLSVDMVKRLKAAGVPLAKADDAYCIQRTRAGRHQRSAGAWSWSLRRVSETDYHMEIQIGSQWPAKELLGGNFHVSVVDWGDYFIDPSTHGRDTFKERGKTGETVGIPGMR